MSTTTLKSGWSIPAAWMRRGLWTEGLKSLILFASCWPEPASSAAGARTLQLLDVFLEQGWIVNLMTAARQRPHSASLPETVRVMPIELNRSSLDPLLHGLQPDLVWFDRFTTEEQFGWRVSAQCPHAKRMLDTIDLHSLRDLRQQALKENRDPVVQDWFSDLALRELAAIYRSDLSLLISEAEREILVNHLHLPESLLHVIPFLCSPEEMGAPRTAPGFVERNHFVTIGNHRHPPNADSIRLLSEKIWPSIRKRCPQAELHIYGADVTPALQALNRPEIGFCMKGRADNAVQTLSRYRVCLAPLRFGAGLKGKLLDAMLAGTPSVTTPVGAEGMQGEGPWPGEVCELPGPFVNAAVCLYENKSTWQICRERITPLLHARFNREQHVPTFRKALQSLVQGKAGTSADHLVGAMLRHHQYRSTEFMSRWIELKNQNQDQSSVDP